MSNLVKHAEFELRKAGLFDKDSDYDGALGPAVLEIVEKFSGQGHSGGSAWMVVGMLEKLLRFKPLTPITADPSEWVEVSESLWQNVRCCSCFSKDGGKTWHDLDDPKELPGGLKPDSTGGV